MEEYRKLYEALLENGELQSFCRTMTGSWEKDKKSFIKQQTDLEAIANGINVNFDLDELEEHFD
jgi:hypothetical protein